MKEIGELAFKLLGTGLSLWNCPAETGGFEWCENIGTSQSTAPEGAAFRFIGGSYAMAAELPCLSFSKYGVIVNKKRNSLKYISNGGRSSGDVDQTFSNFETSEAVLEWLVLIYNNEIVFWGF